MYKNVKLLKHHCSVNRACGVKFRLLTYASTTLENNSKQTILLAYL